MPDFTTFKFLTHNDNIVTSAQIKFVIISKRQCCRLVCLGFNLYVSLSDHICQDFNELLCISLCTFDMAILGRVPCFDRGVMITIW